MTRVPMNVPRGHTRYVALTKPPPMWTLPPPDSRRRNRVYTKRGTPRGIEYKPFKGWVHADLALAMCRRLRAAGSIMRRDMLRDAVWLDCRHRFRNDAHWKEGFRCALAGCHKYGWTRTFDVPSEIPIGRVPGAPCLQCRAWLTPKRRQAIAEQEETPYSALDFDVWQGE